MPDNDAAVSSQTANLENMDPEQLRQLAAEMVKTADREEAAAIDQQATLKIREILVTHDIFMGRSPFEDSARGKLKGIIEDLKLADPTTCRVALAVISQILSSPPEILSPADCPLLPPYRAEVVRLMTMHLLTPWGERSILSVEELGNILQDYPSLVNSILSNLKEEILPEAYEGSRIRMTLLRQATYLFLDNLLSTTENLSIVKLFSGAGLVPALTRDLSLKHEGASQEESIDLTFKYAYHFLMTLNYATRGKYQWLVTDVNNKLQALKSRSKEVLQGLHK